MSRIGRKPIEVPASVTVAISHGRVQVNGPLGELSQAVPTRMQIEKEENEVVVTRPTERGQDRALHGLTRTLIANMVEGVTQGFEKHLEIQGVGYRAQLKGADLELAVGYSHPVVIRPRDGISFDVPIPTQIVVKGIDKQMVGQTAAEIRKVRPPNRTRARESATATSRSAGRSERGHERHEGRSTQAPSSPCPRQDRRDRGSPPPRRAPLEPRDLRPAR